MKDHLSSMLFNCLGSSRVLFAFFLSPRCRFQLWLASYILLFTVFMVDCLRFLKHHHHRIGICWKSVCQDGFLRGLRFDLSWISFGARRTWSSRGYDRCRRIRLEWLGVVYLCIRNLFWPKIRIILLIWNI